MNQVRGHIASRHNEYLLLTLASVVLSSLFFGSAFVKFCHCFQEGYADAKLPKSVPFSILLGDTGFEEIEEQFKSDVRHVRVINPHRRSALELVSLIMEDL